MKIRVDRDVLAEALGWVARALPTRPVVPVLSGLRLDAGTGLTLSCFDYEVSATAQIEAEVGEPGTVIVPAGCWPRSPAACPRWRSRWPRTPTR